ncbi:hypothetical protein B0O99DRAFT_611109 [Bisporella sp. PMI_857]|nr:hypothetical protein B0O99DRAFT_536822 [Bisporella sp. PMI_857]KAH8600607.1 hypothetical protein B0O99DRAFT_611109 [Bisporella sp. PMI_857]
MSENTPFLADSEHDGGESHPIKTRSANAHFKPALKLITILNSLFSILIFALLIVTYVMLRTGPFLYTYDSRDAVRDLAIVLFVNFILATPTIFLAFPIWINLANQFAMSIVVLVFSGKIFGRGWPDSSFCRRWSGPPDYRELPGTYECRHAKGVIEILMAVAGGVSFIIGLFLLTILLLRFVAVSRTKFWNNINIKSPNWKPTGFTVQFTLSVLPNDSKRKTGDTTAPSAEEVRLVDA